MYHFPAFVVDRVSAGCYMLLSRRKFDDERHGDIMNGSVEEIEEIEFKMKIRSDENSRSLKKKKKNSCCPRKRKQRRQQQKNVTRTILQLMMIY